MKLATEGKPCCGLDVLANAPEPVQYAAGELRRFIQLKTGSELPREAINGRSIILRQASDDRQSETACKGMTSPESYAIEADDNHIYLVGIDPAGLVYAVFDFLSREVDITFAGLGDLGVRLNRQSTCEVNLKRRQCSPQLTVRGFQAGISEDAFETAGGLSSLHLQRLDWMAQNRMNYYFVWPRHGENGEAALEDTRRLIQEAKHRGLKVQFGGHIWNYWISGEKYFDKHPEYFSLVDGQRRAGLQQLSLCTSNPAVAKTMADEILAVVDRLPGLDMISIWPADGQGMCQCQQCRKMDRLPEGVTYDQIPGNSDNYARSHRDRNKSARYVRFCNDVARLVGQVRPEVTLTVSFYYDIDFPPEDVTLEPNIQPLLSHYWRCTRHTLDHPGCDNAYYNRITEEWAALYPGRVVIYQYPMGMNGYASLPWPWLPTIHQDWKHMHKMGIAGAMLQSLGSHFTVYGPNYFGFSQMGWDLECPTDDLTSPYYHGLYEQSATPIVKLARALEDRFLREDHEPEDKEFIDSLFDSQVYAEHFPHCLEPTPDAVARILDDETVELMEKYMAEAEDLVNNERTCINVTKLKAAVEYWKLAYRYHLALGQARKLARSKSSQTTEAIKNCIALCQAVMEYIECLPYLDIVSREQILRRYWPRQLKALLQRRSDPFGSTAQATTKWP